MARRRSAIGPTIGGSAGPVARFTVRLPPIMTPSPVAIVQMGLPPERIRQRLGDQADWFAAALGRPRGGLRIVQPFLGEPLPGMGAFSLAIVTGSWSMVTDREDWSERTGAWLADLVRQGKPVLGVCYGHQLMAHALGGRVGDLPGGAERGVFELVLTAAASDDPLLHGVPRRFPAYLSHQQSVLEPPPGARVLGGTARDPFQLLRYGPHAFSMQPHPEFTATIMAACAAGRENGDAALDRRFARELAQSPWLPQPHRLLRRFVRTYGGDWPQGADAVG